MNDVELRDVVGYEGYYKVSNHGDVFSVTKWVGHYTRKCRSYHHFSHEDTYGLYYLKMENQRNIWYTV